MKYVWSWYAQYISRNYFKYRTGLDATSEELVGLRRQDPGFESGFKHLLQRILAGKVLLLVTDRFDESLLVMRRLMLAHRHRSENATAGADTPSNLQSHTTDDSVNSNNKSSSIPVYDMPLDHLLYLPQKKQNKGAPLSAETTLLLMDLQPFDTLLYQAANSMLDKYIYRFYGKNMTAFDRELSWLRSELSMLETVCSKQHKIQHETKQNESQKDVQAALLPLTHIPMEKNGILLNSSASEEKYRKLCEKLRRDNKDLVREVWNSMQAAQ